MKDKLIPCIYCDKCLKGCPKQIGISGSFRAMNHLSETGNLDEARAIQNEANRIIAILCKIGVMQAEKEIMNQLGMDFGSCRAPFKDASEESKALIAKEIMPYIKGFKG